MTIKETAKIPIDLSTPDNSGYTRYRSKFLWALWHVLGFPLVRSNMIPISWLKSAILRTFGAKIGKGVYFKPGIKVKFPWLLIIGDHCWIGEDVWFDNLTTISVGSHVCISQGVYLCTGNHDWTNANMKLFTKPISIADGAWIAARSTLCPGVKIGEMAITTVGSVVTHSVPPNEIWGGNPAKFLRVRQEIRPSTIDHA